MCPHSLQLLSPNGDFAERLLPLVVVAAVLLVPDGDLAVRTRVVAFTMALLAGVAGLLLRSLVLERVMVMWEIWMDLCSRRRPEEEWWDETDADRRGQERDELLYSVLS